MLQKKSVVLLYPVPHVEILSTISYVFYLAKVPKDGLEAALLQISCALIRTLSMKTKAGRHNRVIFSTSKH
jgi:hypothetical protein